MVGAAVLGVDVGGFFSASVPEGFAGALRFGLRGGLRGFVAQRRGFHAASDLPNWNGQPFSARVTVMLPPLPRLTR